MRILVLKGDSQTGLRRSHPVRQASLPRQLMTLLQILCDPWTAKKACQCANRSYDFLRDMTLIGVTGSL
jgi:hypothetical protein